MKIPDNITIGGQIIDVKFIDHLDNGYLGQISLGESEIVIAQNFNGHEQHQESINSTFIHEIIHGILDTMEKLNLVVMKNLLILLLDICIKLLNK
ncbi:hypothetical protein [uncultured phage cr9_1]|uniref:Uncharacterized protein n=1 Tax=uncultured phage cr9_1 TaxID=2986400 RepID=A0AAE7S1U7_9CAUD|nr:hypothetical protein M1M54_gp82 [uncultured phage cr9_1]QWM90200.1 hypothetical protein [uncultured phage cr9_1]